MDDKFQTPSPRHHREAEVWEYRRRPCHSCLTEQSWCWLIQKHLVKRQQERHGSSTIRLVVGESQCDKGRKCERNPLCVKWFDSQWLLSHSVNLFRPLIHLYTSTSAFFFALLLHFALSIAVRCTILCYLSCTLL